MLKKIISCLLLCMILFKNFALVGFAETEEGVLDLSCKSAILIEQSTGRVLYEQNADERLPMASVTKIMTMLLIMEALDDGRITLDDMVTGSERAKSMGGSTIYLDAGESLSVHDMLKGIAVASANDACVAMAEHIAGSEEAFVAMMNEKAQALGMKNTFFKNTNGLDIDGHYSSARDISLMSAALLKYPLITEYTTIWMDSLRNGKFQLANTNKLIRFYKGANGLKTGSTNNALYCLSGSAQRDGMQLVAVVMGAPTSPKRFSDTSKLLDYGFANYQIEDIVHKKDSFGEVEVENGVLDKVSAICLRSYSYLKAKNADDNIEIQPKLYENIHAPVKEGMQVGEVAVLNNGKQIDKIELVAAHAVDKITFISLIGQMCMCLITSMC